MSEAYTLWFERANGSTVPKSVVDVENIIEAAKIAEQMLNAQVPKQEPAKPAKGDMPDHLYSAHIERWKKECFKAREHNAMLLVRCYKIYPHPNTVPKE